MNEAKGRDMLEIFSQAEEVVRAFTKGKRFAEDLLRENERLRYKLLHLQQERLGRGDGGAGRVGSIREENRKLKKELEDIKTHFQTLNEENRDFQSRHEEVEKQNENLLNLYVSGYQLHTTLNEESVRNVIQEILLNLLGAEVFAVWVVDQQTGRLERMMTLDEVRMFEDGPPPLPEKLTSLMTDGESVFAPAGNGSPGDDPLACIPLQLDGKTMGVLAIYRLLQQKEGISALDQELMGLLTSQAATAIIGSLVVSRALPRLRWLGQ